MFHEKLDIELIRLVKNNPVLYDYEHPKYMDFNARVVAWQMIGDKLKRSANDCKIRWVNIRDVHRRILRKNLVEPSHTTKVYKYEQELQFMRSFYRDVTLPPTEEDKTEEWNDYDQPDDYSDDSEKPIKKLKIKRKKSKKRKEEAIADEIPVETSFNEPSIDMDANDSVDAFLLTIGATLKTFSPYHLNVAKSKIFAIVQEHDLQQIVQKERQDPIEKVSTSESGFLD